MDANKTHGAQTHRDRKRHTSVCAGPPGQSRPWLENDPVEPVKTVREMSGVVACRPSDI